ncbi:MAG TPA: nucleoside-diphosphate sugar epimerase/dehydratase [Sedimentisphaerales bacterium]|nr:nucleoside-diphosphate sugar epimerase/dehydratase [Sedimentisphaerales bacterium]
MPDSNTNTQLKQRIQQPSELSPVPAVLLRYRKPLIILAHIVVFAASLMLSFLLVNNMQFKRSWLVIYPALLLFFLIVKLLVFGFFEQYRGWWRYVGISDLLGILRASMVSTLIIVALWFAIGQVESIRRNLPEGLQIPAEGVCMADMFATVLLLAGLRMVIRLYYEEFRTVEASRLKRLLIVGAGDAGEALLREIHRERIAQYEVVGFIDDDPRKQGTNIHGMPVLGTVEQLPKICEDRNIEEIAIAMPEATHHQRRRVVQVFDKGTKIRFRTVPSITDIASGKLRVSQIRNVDINDLLGREAVELDLDLIEAFLKDKTILVTGAGGSIGSEMCRQVCNFNPKLLLLAEMAENPLFYMERELRKEFPDISIKAVVCNITDKIRVEGIFETYKPQVVIHAAAHKHVPLMEVNPGEAIKNNIIGTQIVSDAANHYGTTNFVMISTDKAVNPTSIMGSSKRIAEMYIQGLSRTSKTHFVTVRFGNVLDSDGSVVPIFKKQIAEGGPVTVTHPRMKRYFMTIPEASQLVLQAATMGKGGEIFVLDMGEPVKIIDLARDIITLSGFKPGEDIEITFTNPRPGEKLFEELSIEGEDMQHTRHPKISIWKNIPMDRDKLHAGMNELVAAAQTQNYNGIVQKIRELVPEYTGGNDENAEIA